MWHDGYGDKVIISFISCVNLNYEEIEIIEDTAKTCS